MVFRFFVTADGCILRADDSLVLADGCSLVSANADTVLEAVGNFKQGVAVLMCFSRRPPPSKRQTGPLQNPIFGSEIGSCDRIPASSPTS
jgi:hypothetical protein